MALSADAIEKAAHLLATARRQNHTIACIPEDIRPGSLAEAYAVQDEINVHRVVLAWRAWALLDVAGQQHAHTLLRQSVRFCLDAEQRRRDKNRPVPAVREVLPRLLDDCFS